MVCYQTYYISVHTLYMRHDHLKTSPSFDNSWLSCLSMCFAPGFQLHSKATLHKPVDGVYPRGCICCLHHRRKSQRCFFAGVIASAASRSGPTLRAKILIRQTQLAWVTAWSAWMRKFTRSMMLCGQAACYWWSLAKGIPHTSATRRCVYPSCD